MPTFSFDANAHQYIANDTGEVLPHITGLLSSAGYIDDRWYKEEHSARGQAVHSLCAAYDLGAIEDLASVTSSVKGYLAAHVAAMAAIRPTWEHVEVPFVNWTHRFGGRPDRVGIIDGGLAVLDVKSGQPTKAAPVQTALQAIIIAPSYRVPAESILRFGLYVKKTGRFKLVPHTDPRDFENAYAAIRDFRRVAA